MFEKLEKSVGARGRGVEEFLEPEWIILGGDGDDEAQFKVWNHRKSVLMKPLTMQEYARTHPPSPASDAGMPAQDESKRSQAEEAFTSNKFARMLDSTEGAGKPPEIDADELAALDEAAGYEEINRLLDMQVLQEPIEEDLELGAVLSTRSVMDWRWRNQKWQRRCRYDEFLLVPQQERILVQKPVWWTDDSSSRFWSLGRCLPGQRDAAARFLTEHLQSLQMENIRLLPSLFRHKTNTKNLVLFSHVDDLVGGEREAVEWLVTAFREKFTLQGGELIPADDQDDQEPVRFLKKRHFFTQAGVIISPHEKYADELVQLYGLQHGKPKTTPDVMGENFESEELDEQGKHRFRPTVAADAAVRHVILYLKHIPSLGVLLSYNTANKSKLSEIHGKADPDELNTDLVEVFTDADWAGIGRLKHINVKYLWLQQKIKEGALEMDGVPTMSGTWQILAPRSLQELEEPSSCS
eukprot:s1775_g17.t1